MLPVEPVRSPVANTLSVILGGIFILLPSVYSNLLYDPAQTGKFIFLGYGIALVFLLLAYYTIFGGSHIRVSVSVMDIGLMMLLMYMAVNRYYLQPVHGFSLRWEELVTLALCYVILRRLPFTMYLYLLLAVAGGGILQVLGGALQLLGILESRNAYFPVTGNFFNPGGYAGYLSLVAVISFGLYIHRHIFVADLAAGKKGRTAIFMMEYLPLAALIGCVILLPGLRSRSAFIALAAGLGGVWLMYRNRESKIMPALPLKRLVLAVLLVVGLLYAFYLFKRNSADGRLLIYKVSATLVQEHPVFGVGMDRFKAYYMDAQARWFEQQGQEEEAAQLADNTFYAFNEPLQFVVENGITGLLLVAAALFFFVRSRSDKPYMPIRTIAYGIMATSLCFAMFTYTSDNLAMKYILVLSLAILSGTGSKVLVNIRLPLQSGKAVTLPVLSLLALFVVYGFGSHINRMRQSFAGWAMAQNAYVKGLYKESNREFESVYPQLHTNGEFLMQYGKSCAMAGNYRQALTALKSARLYLNSSVIETGIGDCERSLGNYLAAEQSYFNAMYMIPNRFYPLYLLMTLYQESGATAKAVKMARSIKIKKVKVPSKAIAEIKGFADNLIKDRPDDPR